MKGKKKRLLAGTLALLLSCSTLLNTGITALASEQSEEHAQIQEVKQEEAASETLPELEEVKEQLTEEELVYAEDLTIKAGESFDLETDYRGFQKNDEKVKVTFLKAEGDSGNSFDFNTPGSYQAFYRVDPLSGNPSYQIMRRIVVEARENSTQEPQGEVSQHTEDGSGEDGEADPDPEIPEVLTEEPEMPDAGAELIDLTPKEDKGMFLSVVPAAMEQQKGSNVHLVQGEKIPYPSNVGNYSTSYFTVNGHVAYCLESMKASPPTSDYVANEFESNPELQKVLYYGYGGPGDITGEYMPSFDWKTKYIFTHLAAAYSYCGMDGFYGCTFEDIKASGVWGYIQHIYSLEAPPTAAITLSPKEAKGYESGKEQRTGEFTLKGDHRNYITLKMPENVTYHSGSTKQTGTVKINGNTTFYFSAPKTVTGTWNSGKLKGQMGTQWKTLVLSTSSGSQDIGYGAFFEEESASVEFTVKWLDLARVKVTKKDKNSKVNLSGAVFGIYSDSACKNLLVQMPATDSNGTSEVELPKTQDTVYLKEISVPEGYKLNTESFNVKLETGKTTSVAVTNEEQKGKITIRKKGEVLTGVTGEEGNLTFVYGNADFAGAEYNIYAAEDIYSQDKVTKVHKAGDLVESLTTGEDGSAVSKELYLGKYKVVEQKAPENLVIGKTEQERTQFVTLSYAGQNVELSQGETVFTNARPEISVNVVKKSKHDDVTLEGATFGLYVEEDLTAADGKVLVEKGSLVERAVSDREGMAVFHADIPLNFHYSVKEIQAPDKYYMTDEVYRFFYEYKDDSTYTYTFSHDFKNEEVRGEVHVSKIDQDSQGFISQGDATLVGAKYGLYAAQDIEHPNKKDGIVHKKGELVAQGTISSEGTVDFKNLYLGNYFVKEIEPAEGYLLDETEYPVEVSYEGQEVQIVHREVTVKETVKKQAFQLIKISEDGEQTETELVEGAGFKVFLISELSGVKDGSLKPGNGSYYTPEDFITYDYSKDETASYWENGKKITVPELFTDKKGYLKSPELPYGTYVVFESTVPENLKGIRPFIVQISEDSREPQVWRVFDDRPLQYYFKIVKKDAQTQKPVLDNSAAYKIYDVEAEKYVEMIVRYPKKEVVSVFRTNEEGYLITPEQLKCGTYRIEEVEAPENYVQVGFENVLLKDGKEVPLNEVADGGAYQEAKKAPITITVDSDTVHQVEEETGKFIVVIEQYNDEAVGSLTIHKKGEKLSGASKVEEKFLTKMKNGVAGFVNQVSSFFTGEEVMEKEKGYEFDYEEGNMEGAEFAIHAKETIYTPDGQKDEAGNRIVKYEKDALVARMVTDKEGKAVLNNLPIGKYYVVEEKAGQNCVLDSEAKEFEIAYKGQEVAVDYVTMELTNQRQKVSLSLLKKDAETGKPLEGVVFGLYAQEDIKNAAGEVVVEKDALIELGTTDEEGKLVFQADLPHGKYYIQEVEHKPGYLPNDEVYSFDASYTDQTLELLAFSEEISNQPTITEFTKVDLTGGQEIEGAKMQILDQDGKVVEEWVSKKEPHVVYALEPGEYVLHEEQAPTEQGYVRAEDVKFVVEETGDIQKVKMEDDHTKVSISKTDITDGKEIEGAKLQILDQDGEVVESWTTGEEHLIEYLPIGTYTLHEEAAVDGYIVANDVEFTVEETGEIQKVKMEDERAMGQLVIVKTDADSKAALEGVEFVLLEKETGKEVGRLKTGKDGKAVSELLPIGTYENGVFKEPITYVLKETATLKGYEKTEEEWEIVFTYQNDKTPVIEVVKEIQNKKIPETPGTVKPGPKTGDDTNWFLPLLALGVSAGMVAGLLYYRKRHKKA